VRSKVVVVSVLGVKMPVRAEKVVRERDAMPLEVSRVVLLRKVAVPSVVAVDKAFYLPDKPCVLITTLKITWADGHITEAKANRLRGNRHGLYRPATGLRALRSNTIEGSPRFIAHHVVGIQDAERSRNYRVMARMMEEEEEGSDNDADGV